MANDYGKLIKYLLGMGAPAPYMGLDLKDRIGNAWDNWAMYHLPQAPGMQPVAFQSLEDLPVVQKEAFRGFQY